METFQVARYYEVDPDEVEYEWTNADFLDRQEFMLVTNELERIQRKRDESKTRPRG